MTWQEELRKLDEGLASGNVSADEYRTRRDQILSSAVTSTGQQDTSGAQGSADSTQVIAPLSGQQLPAQQASQPSVAEAPQIVSPSDPGAERTQAVGPWQLQQQQQQPYPASPAGGFAQPGQPPASPAGGFAQPPASPSGGFAQPPLPPQNQPWNAPNSDSAPPWGGRDFPPLAPPQNNPDWRVSQGPESNNQPASSNKGRTVLVSALALVVLAGIGVAVWLLFIKDDGSDPANVPTAQSQRQSPPSPTSSPLPQPPAPKEEPKDNDTTLVDPPGEERAGGGDFDLERLEDNKLLPESVIAALGDAGMDEGLLKSTTDNSNTIGLYALEVSSEDAAVTVANEYAVNQQESGLPAVRDMSMQGVQVLGAGNPNGDSVYRAVYVVYDRVVIIDVYGKDQQAVEATFTELLEEQVHHAPPTVTKG